MAELFLPFIAQLLKRPLLGSGGMLYCQCVNMPLQHSRAVSAGAGEPETQRGEPARRRRLRGQLLQLVEQRQYLRVQLSKLMEHIPPPFAHEAAGAGKEALGF